VISGFRADMTLVEQAGFLASLAGQLHQELAFRNKDFEKMAKFLNCAPTPCLITSGILRMVEEKKNLTNRIQELEEKKANLDKEHWEAQDELVYRRREMESPAKKVEKVKEERDSLHNQNSRQRFKKIWLEKELKAATDTLTFEEGIWKQLQVAMEASRIIMETDKVAFLKKEILVQFKGVPQRFDRLHTTIQDNSNKIIAGQEGLENQLKAVLEYLREKPRTAGKRRRRWRILRSWWLIAPTWKRRHEMAFCQRESNC
jgi:hypothetical protein